MLQKAFDTLSHDIGLPVVIAVGTARDSFTDLGQSFAEARQALTTRWQDGDSSSLLRYSDYGSNSEEYRFSDSDMKTPIRAVYQPDREAVVRVLQTIRAQNECKDLSTVARVRLVQDIPSVVIEASREHAPTLERTVGSVPHYLETYRSLGDFCVRAESILLSVHSETTRKETGRVAELRTRIVSFLESNYSDPQLCLASVSDEFQMNPQYFCRFFKGGVGRSFAKFVEDLRMSDAEALLTGTGLPLKDVAARVRYQSWNSFYKAFRRRYSVPPGLF